MQDDSKKIATSVMINEKVRRALKVEAARLGVTMGEVIEGACRLWLQGRPATQEQAVDEAKPVNWTDS